ncbi:MAG: 30S ribosomal protein S18 [Patescibacteria group bacterium]|nr:30S ribosomal protein S18 [Patescibacteria group bacterium]
MVKAKSNSKRFVRKHFVRRRVCAFCTESTLPEYKDASRLRRFVTERGKIMPRAKTGVCAQHQRCLAAEIKKARHIALLPYASGL